MTIRPAPAAAESLQKNAEDIAFRACDQLLQQRPDIRERFGDDAQRIWMNHLNQRVLELSAAVSAGEPGLFGSRLSWSKNAMAARNLSGADLDASLISLRDGVEQVLSGSARDAAVAVIDSARADLGPLPAAAKAPGLDAGLELDRLALRYIQAIVAGNVLPAMDMVVDAVRAGLSVKDAYLRVLLPAQREVGRLWHMNQVSVAEEHLVTSTTQRLMAVLASRARHAPMNGYSAVTAAVAGNAHELGIRAITYLLEFNGWRTIYLGPDVPQADLAALIEGFDADVVMLSLALSSQLPALKSTIAAIRAQSGTRVKLLVGGNGLRGAATLWKDIGADGYGQDAETALELAEEIVLGTLRDASGS